MTVQEAIRELRLLNQLTGSNPNVLDVPYSKEELFGFKAGLSLAVEALQKQQVPMKPIVDEIFCDTDAAGREIRLYMQKIFICPKCHRFVSIDENCRCGQLIEWKGISKY